MCATACSLGVPVHAWTVDDNCIPMDSPFPGKSWRVPLPVLDSMAWTFVEKPIVLNLLCQTLSRILLESPLRALQCGGMTGADGSRIPLSALMASTLSFVLPSDGISNTPCLVSCPRACKTRWFGVPSQKTKNIDKKTSKNIVLDCCYAGLFLSSHCPFTDQRCLDIRCDNGLFFGKRSRLLLYGVTGLYHSPSSVLITVRDGARHPRGIYLLLSCAAEF